MKLSNEGKALIKNFEGLRLKAYKCSANVDTIGYGHTGGVKAGDVITQEQADAFFEADIAKFEAAVNAAGIAGLKQNQFDALVSLCYNIGVEAFQKSSLLRLAKINPQNLQIREKFLLWSNVTVGGKLTPSAGLMKRRQKEADFYFK
jgi:lysozyme